jgi:hypothetical protein
MNDIERDAARYRWLRNQQRNTAGTPFIARNDGYGFSMWTGEYADEVIDAAIAAEPIRYTLTDAGKARVEGAK